MAAAGVEVALDGALEYTSFREGREDQASKALALSTAAGWRQYDLSKWLHLLHACDELFVAKRADGTFAGCLLRVHYDAVGAISQNQKSFEMFGMMLVDPACRGMGVAKQLLCNFETKAYESGAICGLGIATADGFPVYHKRGYRVATADSKCYMLKALGSVAASLPCGDAEVEIFFQDADRSSALQHVSELDRRITGLERGSRLNYFGSLEGGLVAIAREAGEIVGALIGVKDSQSGAMVLGPVLGDDAVAKTMLGAVGEQLGADAGIGLFVLNHSTLVDELKAAGFEQPGPATTGTMLLAEAPELPGARDRYVAIINPAFG